LLAVEKLRTSRWRMLGVCAAILYLLASRRPAAGAPTAAFDPADIERLLQLLAGISDEYDEAFDGGKLVRANEIDEARLLFQEALQLATQIDSGGPTGIAPLLKAIAPPIDRHENPKVIAQLVVGVRNYIVVATGVMQHVAPKQRPSLAGGREVFEANCARCHGTTGAGDGKDAARLGIKPANFTDLTFIRNQTPEDAFNVITLGRRKTGMPSWGDALTIDQRWAVISYIWSLGRAPTAVDEGQRLYAKHCASCHGTTGDGKDAQASPAARPLTRLSALLEGSQRTDTENFNLMSRGVANTPMQAFAPALDETERWQLAAFVRKLSLEGVPGSPGVDEEDEPAAALADVKRIVGQALDAHRRGDPGAGAIAGQGYLRFEPLEHLLGRHDLGRVATVERQFTKLRDALHDPKAGDPEVLARALYVDLDAFASALGAPPAVARSSAAEQGSPAKQPARLDVALVNVRSSLAAEGPPAAPGESPQATPAGRRSEGPAAAVTAGGSSSFSVSVSAEDDQGDAPLSVKLEVDTSDSGGTPPYDITWDFGDGSPFGHTKSLTHVYEVPGEFRASVVVRDKNGKIAYDSTDIVVGEPDEPAHP
jgi:mono/diheme cytochrome c family protein